MLSHLALTLPCSTCRGELIALKLPCISVLSCHKDDYALLTWTKYIQVVITDDFLSTTTRKAVRLSNSNTRHILYAHGKRFFMFSPTMRDAGCYGNGRSHCDC